MTPAARYQAAIEILDRILEGGSAEKALTNWARASRFAGSKDRAAIRDIVFDGLRRRNSAAHNGGALSGRGIVLGLLRLDAGPVAEIFTGDRHAPAALSDGETALLMNPPEETILDLPDWLYAAFERSLGSEASSVERALRARAPTTLRTNLAKTTREKLQEGLAAHGIATTVNPVSPSALTLGAEARNLTALPEFQDGHFELQDAGSQALVDRLPLPKGGRILDYCAGGGGKTLAMAARQSAHYFAHDISASRLAPLKERAERAGVRVKLLAPGAAGGQGPYDLVLCDAPCTGSGAWRRSPEAKWKLSEADLQRTCALQASILQEASALVKKGGVLAYATCSVLEEENEGIVSAFLSKTGEWSLLQQEHWKPNTTSDGFYIALITLKA
ncbi:MAG: RsmB/NOP family class I SAM-dependent RNA methyltransferase [Rhodobacteraceae bacterium]|nr:RsmB/NOP family class I SAM-dependent RNA methyltransferase [Paracoccaceae bacterium]